MAFESVSDNRDFIISSKMEVGAEIEGYVVEFTEGKYGTNLLMENKSGDRFMVVPSGNMRYYLEDKLIIPGLYTKIVRRPNQDVKGRSTSWFEVLQDADDSRRFGTSNTLSTNTTSTSTPEATEIAKRIKKVNAQLKTS